MDLMLAPNYVTDGENADDDKRITDDFIAIAVKDETVSEASEQLISCLVNGFNSCRRRFIDALKCSCLR
jgi:hypothetical protein